MSTTRPIPLTEEDMKRIAVELRSAAQNGARIELSDPRLTRATNWILAAGGAIIIAFMGWIVNRIEAQNQSMAALQVQNATIIAQLTFQNDTNKSQDNRLTIYDDRLRTIEQRFYQGRREAP